MKFKWLMVLGLVLSAHTALSADVRIGNMTAASTLGGTELFAGVQSGAPVKITANQIKTFVGPGGSGTVTSVANPVIFGATCSVSNATTVPAITCTAGTAMVLGTPASGVLTNLTGLPISTGLSGAGTGVLTALGTAVNTSGGAMTSAATLTANSPVIGGGSGVGQNVGTRSGNTTAFVTTTGTQTSGDCVKIDVSGNHVANGSACGGGTVTGTIPVSWDSTTTVANTTIPLALPPWASGTITSVSYYTNGTATPSFTAQVTIGGTPVTSCSALTVNSSTPATTTCTAANTLTSSSSVALVISGVSGVPSQAIVSINFTHTLN